MTINIGTKVEMTKMAIKAGLDGPSKRKTGVVVGYSNGLKEPHYRIKRDGLKTIQSFHPSFWKVKKHA